MPRSFSGIFASGFLLLAATMAAFAAAQVQAPAEQTLPATDINRESNNPAKQAIRARQAQERDNAGQKAADEDTASQQSGPVSDIAQLLERVEAALRSDPRTQQLGIDVRLEEQDLVALHGAVPSVESRTAVMDVASKVAGATRVRNHLIVSAKK